MLLKEKCLLASAFKTVYVMMIFIIHSAVIEKHIYNAMCERIFKFGTSYAWAEKHCFTFWNAKKSQRRKFFS